MARIQFAPEVVADFERILHHLYVHEVANSSDRIGDIIQAISILETSPYVGRLATSGTRRAVGALRELVIGKTSRGYVALYCYIAEIDTVFVLAIRSQREAGYTRSG